MFSRSSMGPYRNAKPAPSNLVAPKVILGLVFVFFFFALSNLPCASDSGSYSALRSGDVHQPQVVPLTAQLPTQNQEQEQTKQHDQQVGSQLPPEQVENDDEEKEDDEEESEKNEQTQESDTAGGNEEVDEEVDEEEVEEVQQQKPAPQEQEEDEEEDVKEQEQQARAPQEQKQQEINQDEDDEEEEQQQEPVPLTQAEQEQREINQAEGEEEEEAEEEQQEPISQEQERQQVKQVEGEEEEEEEQATPPEQQQVQQEQQVEQRQEPPPLSPPFQLCSPNQKLCVEIKSLMSRQESSEVDAVFTATYKSAKRIPMHGKLKFTFDNAAPGGAKHSFSQPLSSSSGVLQSSWNPIAGSQKTFEGSYIETNVSWAFSSSSSSSSSSSVVLQFRVYDYMLASRVVYGLENSGKFSTSFNYADAAAVAGDRVEQRLETTVCADHGDEKGAYKTDGDTPLVLIGSVHQLPLSVDNKNEKDGSRLSTWFSEACTFDTVNARVQGTLNTEKGFEGIFRDLRAGGEPKSPFFVWQFSNTMIGLANYGESAGMLCDAPREGPSAFDWVTAGKQVRVTNVQTLKSKESLEENVGELANLCKIYDICQYLLFDAGWYGNEYNITSDPMKPIPGFDLDEVVRIGKKHGRKTIVYLNELALTSSERVDAISIYLRKAGVDGVKMGFMTVTTTPDMRRVIDYVRIFGRHQLVVNIHDHFCGFGIQRTFPHLLSVEGVAGDEHFDQDYTQQALILPFTRAKAGRMDFTFQKGVKELTKLRLSNLAQVAKSVILGVNGLWTIYWYAGWDALKILGGNKNSPFSLWNEMSNNEWIASVYLDSVPGEYLSVARKTSSGIWYIVALGRVPHTFTWPLSSFLSVAYESNVSFRVQRWTEKGGVSNDVDDVVSIESTLTCSVEDDVASTRHGGCIMRLTPVEQHSDDD